MAAKSAHMAARCLRAFFTVGVCSVILLTTSSASSAAAQKDKKKKKDPSAPADTRPIIPMSDEQQIDYRISEMLGAWQLGDTERLHQAYADDAVFVSGLWGPPIFGWASYLPLYQQQRARIEHVRLDRVNTFIKVSGAVGWSSYQWDFSASVDGQPIASRGQTTLVFEKRNDRWLIVHNHTSLPQATSPASAQPEPVPAPRQPPKPSAP
jgi:ketosteroid isomerase-like protein